MATNVSSRGSVLDSSTLKDLAETLQLHDLWAVERFPMHLGAHLTIAPNTITEQHPSGDGFKGQGQATTSLP
jgi:hypothetical protein